MVMALTQADQDAFFRFCVMLLNGSRRAERAAEMMKAGQIVTIGQLASVMRQRAAHMTTGIYWPTSCR